jgi:hypothetical protein
MSNDLFIQQWASMLRTQPPPPDPAHPRKKVRRTKARQELYLREEVQQRLRALAVEGRTTVSAVVTALVQSQGAPAILKDWINADVEVKILADVGASYRAARHLEQLKASASWWEPKLAGLSKANKDVAMALYRENRERLEARAKLARPLADLLGGDKEDK